MTWCDAIVRHLISSKIGLPNGYKKTVISPANECDDMHITSIWTFYLVWYVNGWFGHGHALLFCLPACPLLPFNRTNDVVSNLIKQSGPLFCALRWRHNGRDSVSNHQSHHCLLNRLFRRRSKKTSKLRVTGLCVGNSQGTGEFPAEMASNAENVSIWWRHHGPSKVSANEEKNYTCHVFYHIAWDPAEITNTTDTVLQ